MADENRSIAETHVLVDAKIGVDADAEVGTQTLVDAEIGVHAEAEAGSDAVIRTAIKPKETGQPAVILYRPSPDSKFVVAAMMTPFLPRDQQPNYRPWDGVHKAQQPFFIPIEPSEKNSCCPITLTLRPGINENLSCVRADEISAVPARLFEWYRDDEHHGQRYNLATESRTALLEYITSKDELRRVFQTAKDRVHTLDRAIQAASASDNCAILSDGEVEEGSFEIVHDDAPSRELSESDCSTTSHMSLSDQSINKDAEGMVERDVESDGQDSEQSDSIVQVTPDNEEDADEVEDRYPGTDRNSPESHFLSDAQSEAGDGRADVINTAHKPDLAETEPNTHLPGQVTCEDQGTPQSQLQEASATPLPGTEDAEGIPEDAHSEFDSFEHVAPEEIHDHTFQLKLIAALFMLFGMCCAIAQLDAWVAQPLNSWLVKIAFRFILALCSARFAIDLLITVIFWKRYLTEFEYRPLETCAFQAHG